MQGGNVGCWWKMSCAPVVTQLPSPLERTRNPWVQIMALPLTGKARLAFSRSLSFWLSVHNRNGSTSGCDRDYIRKTCGFTQDRVWDTGSGNLVLDPVPIFLPPSAPILQQTEIFKTPKQEAELWEVEIATPAGSQEGTFYRSPYTGNEDQGRGMKIVSKERCGFILYGVQPSFPFPSTKWGGVPSARNKGMSLASRYLCPLYASFSGFSWSPPFPRSSSPRSQAPFHPASLAKTIRHHCHVN